MAQTKQELIATLEAQRAALVVRRYNARTFTGADGITQTERTHSDLTSMINGLTDRINRLRGKTGYTVFT